MTSSTTTTSYSVRSQQWREFWFYFSVNKTAVAGLVFLIGVVLMAILADVISPHSPTEQYREFAEIPPAWMEGGQMRFF